MTRLIKDFRLQYAAVPDEPFMICLWKAWETSVLNLLGLTSNGAVFLVCFRAVTGQTKWSKESHNSWAASIP